MEISEGGRIILSMLCMHMSTKSQFQQRGIYCIWHRYYVVEYYSHRSTWSKMSRSSTLNTFRFNYTRIKCIWNLTTCRSFCCDCCSNLHKYCFLSVYFKNPIPTCQLWVYFSGCGCIFCCHGCTLDEHVYVFWHRHFRAHFDGGSTYRKLFQDFRGQRISKISV